MIPLDCQVQRKAVRGKIYLPLATSWVSHYCNVTKSGGNVKVLFAQFVTVPRPLFQGLCSSRVNSEPLKILARLSLWLFLYSSICVSLTIRQRFLRLSSWKSEVLIKSPTIGFLVLNLISNKGLAACFFCKMSVICSFVIR